jgi:hypothetical protein
LKIEQNGNFVNADASIDFNPILWMMFMMGAAAGPVGKEEAAFAMWIALHRPTWAGVKVRAALENRVPIEDLIHLQALPKAEFFEAFLSSKRD